MIYTTYFAQLRNLPESIIPCFNEQVLGALNATDVILDLSRMIYSFNVGESDICLVCYEKPDDFCHRHLVAQWLRANGFSCTEWMKG